MICKIRKWNPVDTADLAQTVKQMDICVLTLS